MTHADMTDTATTCIHSHNTMLVHLLLYVLLVGLIPGLQTKAMGTMM